MSLASLKFLYIAMCAHVKQLLHFQIWMTSAMSITPLSSSKYSQQDNSIWKLTLVGRIIPLKHSHSIYFHFFVIITSGVLHACRNERKKLNVQQYENLHYLQQWNDTSQKKISAVIKTFSVFLGFGLRFLIVLFQVAGWIMGFGGFF